MHPSPSRSGTGQASAPIHPLARWQGPVFLVNSRLGRFCATPSGCARKVPHPTGVPLLPKLRGQFAEFLDRGSLVRLRSVLLAHRCRFAVRAPCPLGAGLFWATGAHRDSGRAEATPLAVPSRCWGCSRHPRATRRHRPCPLGRLPCPVASPRPCKRRHSGAGLLTCCPSPTPRGLGLGPTNPERIILAQEPLGLRRGGFAPPLCATHAGIRTRLRSTPACAGASRPRRRSPTDAARCCLCAAGAIP